MKARFIALAALVLGLASCQQEFNGVTPVGGEVDFQLQVDARELATRAGDSVENPQNSKNSAFGAIDYYQGTDWSQVDLRYSLEVYDADALDKAPVKDRMVVIVDEYQPVTFDLRLVPNRNYRFVVFADFVDEGAQLTENNEALVDYQTDLGLHHVINGTLQNITIKDDAINNESTDAYFFSGDFRVENSKGESIVLKRPYAKVRVIATDLHELNLNVEPTSVVVAYTAKHPQTFNAVTGKIGTTEENVEYTLSANYNQGVRKEELANHYYNAGYDEYTAENMFVNANGDVRHKYMTLFTDYILAEDQQTAIHFTMTVKDGEETIKTTDFNTDIPVERNHLTTVIGNVLTTATEINVTIDDNFENYYEIETVFVSSAREFQEALDAYENGQVILFDGNIEGNVVINQKVDVHYLIEGNGYYYDGTIEINGDARQADSDSVTLRNINFKTEKEGINVIDANENKAYGNNYNYAHNITIEDCTFELGEGSVAVKMRQSKNVVIKNCEMTDGHSFAQFYGVNGVTVSEVKVENVKNGISFGTSTNAVVKASTFDVEGYGFRGEPGGDLLVDSTKITAGKPVIVRKLTAGNYDLTINSTELNSLMGYQVIFTNGDDEGALVEPQGTFNFNADAEYLVFPDDTVMGGDSNDILFEATNIFGEYDYYGDEGGNYVFYLSDKTFNGDDSMQPNSTYYCLDIYGEKVEGDSNGYVTIPAGEYHLVPADTGKVGTITGPYSNCLKLGDYNEDLELEEEVLMFEDATLIVTADGLTLTAIIDGVKHTVTYTGSLEIIDAR